MKILFEALIDDEEAGDKPLTQLYGCLDYNN